MLEINYWAVLVSGVAAMVIGFLWYGPLFGKAWMRGMGWDPNDRERMERMKKGANTAYPQMFIGSLLMAFVFAHVLAAFAITMGGNQGISEGLQGALWMWLGFILPVKYGDKLWNGKGFKYVSIDLGYYLVLLAVMSMILVSWK